MVRTGGGDCRRGAAVCGGEVAALRGAAVAGGAVTGLAVVGGAPVTGAGVPGVVEAPESAICPPATTRRAMLCPGAVRAATIPRNPAPATAATVTDRVVVVSRRSAALRADTRASIVNEDRSRA